jgi:hypothetical protein
MKRGRSEDKRVTELVASRRSIITTTLPVIAQDN